MVQISDLQKAHQELGYSEGCQIRGMCGTTKEVGHSVVGCVAVVGPVHGRSGASSSIRSSAGRGHIGRTEKAAVQLDPLVGGGGSPEHHVGRLIPDDLPNLHISLALSAVIVQMHFFQYRPFNILASLPYEIDPLQPKTFSHQFFRYSQEIGSYRLSTNRCDAHR